MSSLRESRVTTNPYGKQNLARPMPNPPAKQNGHGHRRGTRDPTPAPLQPVCGLPAQTLACPLMTRHGAHCREWSILSNPVCDGALPIHRVVATCLWMMSCMGTTPPSSADIVSVPADLEIPPLASGPPRAGHRVQARLPGYAATDVYHVIYLPSDWLPGKSYPVIVELAGNGPYRSPFGDVSTGLPEGSKLGYGLSAGKGYLWFCLPYLKADGRAIATQWWGDRPRYDPQPTLRYLKRAVPELCQQYGGDPRRVVLAGFSRGAIACNYLGLYDDEIARLWAAFIPYSHYDGVFENWGYPGADRESARTRLGRLGKRPQWVAHEQTSDPARGIAGTRRYLKATGVAGDFTFFETGFRNHNDAWVLRPSPARAALRSWLHRVVAQPADSKTP